MDRQKLKRLGFAALLVFIAVAFITSRSGNPCGGLRNKVEIAQHNAEKAERGGDSAMAATQRSIVDERARKARGEGCDVTDLVSDSVGR